MDPIKLHFGWCQCYMGIPYHMEDTYKEKDLPLVSVSSICYIFYTFLHSNMPTLKGRRLKYEMV